MQRKLVGAVVGAMLMAIPAFGIAAPMAGANTVNSAAIVDGAIATVDIANGAVTGAKMATGTVTATQLANGAVTTSKLFGNISGSKLANGTVTGVKIAAGTVTATQLANGAVTSAKLGFSCTSGQILQFNGSSWVCSAGTPGPIGLTGPQGVKGDTGLTGPAAHYSNVVVVAKSGGDFTDPINALCSIADASETNRYLVKIMPGVYDITNIDTNCSPGDHKGAINLREYVDIEGSGETNTVITSNPNLPNYGLIRGASNCSLKKLKIVNSTGWNTYHAAYVVMLSDSRFYMSAPTENFEMSEVIIEIPNNLLDFTGTGILSGYPGPITFNNITINMPYGGIGISGGPLTLKNSEINANINVYDSSVFINNKLSGGISGSGLKCIGNYDAGYNPVVCP